MHENMHKIDSPHLLSDKVQLKNDNVLERLIRRNQAYKTALSHAINTKNTSFQLLHQINKIDFKQRWNDQNSSFDVELSFTWLDWRIMDIVQSNADFATKDFGER